MQGRENLGKGSSAKPPRGGRASQDHINYQDKSDASSDKSAPGINPNHSRSKHAGDGQARQTQTGLESKISPNLSFMVDSIQANSRSNPRFAMAGEDSRDSKPKRFSHAGHRFQHKDNANYSAPGAPGLRGLDHESLKEHKSQSIKREQDSIRPKAKDQTTGGAESTQKPPTDSRQDSRPDGIDSIMLDNIPENYQFHSSAAHTPKKPQRPTPVHIIQQEPTDEEPLNERAEAFKAGRLFMVFGIFILSFGVFIFAVYAKMIAKPPVMDPYNKKSRDYPWSTKTDIDAGLRGKIYSLDDYVVSSSHKLYKAALYVPSIYEEKRELLISLINLYTGLSIDSINYALSRGGNVVLADSTNPIVAANLRILNQKLANLGVYKKCTFSYVNKTNLEDSDIQALIAHARIVKEKGRERALDSRILRLLDKMEQSQISEERALQELNLFLVEYKNSQIDLGKECYTPIFTYNAEVRDGATTKIERGLDISVSQIEREYPFNELMQPLLGFTNYAVRSVDGRSFDDKMKLVAQSGVEKYRDGILSAKRDGKVAGLADRSGNIVFNKYATTASREDGFHVKLTIPLVLQSKLQRIVEAANRQYRAQQVVAGIMDPGTGEILALASSSTFNPNPGSRDSGIEKAMRVAAAERSFEPGSTIKPLVFSYLLNLDKINFKEVIDLHDGIYKLRTFTIRDSSPIKRGTPEDILIRSSNIGMTKLTKNLSGAEMHALFEAFGVGEATGVDIANEATGLLPRAGILAREVEKGAASYGYGLRMSFMQLLRSYAVFNNGGFLVVPHVTKHFIAPDSRIYYPALEKPRQIISEESAATMQRLLQKVVEKGTAKKAAVEGLIIGGKTGTAREKEQGETIYNGSFFGYASDGERTYTIGVVTYGSQSSEDYYAGQTSAPVFAEVAQLLAKEGYLKKAPPPPPKPAPKKPTQTKKPQKSKRI